MANRNWDPRKIFDVSPEEKAAIEERARMRADLKAEWQKKISNPNRGSTGFIFDAAVQRYFSTRSGGYQYFKPTPYTGALTFGIVIAPMIAFYFIAHHNRDKKEALLSTGMVSYRDRHNKFLN